MQKPKTKKVAAARVSHVLFQRESEHGGCKKSHLPDDGWQTDVKLVVLIRVLWVGSSSKL